MLLGRKERIMTMFIMFCVGFVCGALVLLITALIANSDDVDEREQRYWEDKHKKG